MQEKGSKIINVSGAPNVDDYLPNPTSVISIQEHKNLVICRYTRS